MKSISAIHLAITENTKNIILVKRAPHISIRESHTVSISAMSNSFHNIVAREVPDRSFNTSRTEAIPFIPQILTLRSCEEKNGRSKGYKGNTLMQAL